MSEIGDVFVLVQITTKLEAEDSKLLPNKIDETWVIERSQAKLKEEGTYVEVVLGRKYKEKDA